MKSKFLNKISQNEVTMRKFIPHNQWIFRFLFNTIYFVIVDIANRSSITKGPDMGVYKRESTQYYHNVVSV